MSSKQTVHLTESLANYICHVINTTKTNINRLKRLLQGTIICEYFYNKYTWCAHEKIWQNLNKIMLKGIILNELNMELG